MGVQGQKKTTLWTRIFANGQKIGYMRLKKLAKILENLPKFLLVVVGWSGKRSRNVNSFWALSDGVSQQVIFSFEWSSELLLTQTFRN